MGWIQYSNINNTDLNFVQFVGTSSGGSKGGGGAQGTRPPLQPKFLHFHAVFGEN